MEGKVCSKCKQWKPLEEYHKKKTSKDGRRSHCKECTNKTSIRKPRVEIKEGMKKCIQCGAWKPLDEFNKDKKHKDGRRSECKECTKKYIKRCSEVYKEKRKEYQKQYRKVHVEYFKEYHKQYYKDNIENNLQYISSIVEPIRPILKELSLPVYGYIYKFENIKTGHIYIGQSTTPIDRRYGSNVIKSWIKDRKRFKNQKFIDELIEEDIKLTETLDVAFCQYHLDKLEAYYIDKYDSFLNGYNNQPGNHNTNDGIEEFNQILLENNLEFIDGKLVKIA
jgi:hypothetical protein